MQVQILHQGLQAHVMHYPTPMHAAQKKSNKRQAMNQFRLLNTLLETLYCFMPTGNLVT